MDATLLNKKIRAPVKVSKEPRKVTARIVHLCAMTVLLPVLFLGVPLYVRNFIYYEQIYPLGMSDIRLLDSRVSTIWCQGQTVKCNTPFNAFLVPHQPEIGMSLETSSMTRRIFLEDDMKEYWGFYLLTGSVVTVSTCVRWPGASLIIIKGHRHLKQCAYIGDDSSEELDEMDSEEVNAKRKNNNDPSNHPQALTKIDPQMILARQLGNISNKIISDNSSESIINNDDETVYTNHVTGRKPRVTNKFNKMGQDIHLKYAEELDNIEKQGDRYIKTKFTNKVEVDSDTKLLSKEVFNEMLIKLKQMGEKGKDILDQLNKEILKNEGFPTQYLSKHKKVKDIKEGVSAHKNSTNGGRNKRNVIRKLLNKTTQNIRNKMRKRRQISISSLKRSLEDNETGLDKAQEEDMYGEDGLAQIRGTINETTRNDKSNSEFWSSFSSSEESLMSCDGLLLSLPLSSNRQCEPNKSDEEHLSMSHHNTVSYKIPSNGYYFFIFNSENEVHTNFLSINFKLERATYNISKAEMSCKNQSSCSLPLRFWSSQKVILELLTTQNNTPKNEEFVAWSTCEPRTTLYAGFILAVPFIFIIFAFQ